MSKNSLLPGRIFLIILLAALFALSGAFFLEYVFELKPCILCIYQRYLYIAISIICLLQITSKKYFKIFLYLLFITVIMQMLLVLYHLGIEYGFLQETLKCTNKDVISSSIEELREQILNNKTGSCSKPVKIIADISLTELSAVYAFLITILVTFSIRRINATSR